MFGVRVLFSNLFSGRSESTANSPFVRSVANKKTLSAVDLDVFVNSTRKVANKFTKISRAGRYRIGRAEGAPLFWHVGVPNFGDDINPWFFSSISDVKMRLSTSRNHQHFLGVGSLLDRATENSVVLGSGMLRPLENPIHPNTRFIAVRGEYSAEATDCGFNVLRGDPLVLSNLLFRPPQKKKYRLGIVPHVRSFDHFFHTARRKGRIIDPSVRPLKVIEQIAACEFIASQSLHGLIVADALNIPNVWVRPAANMDGGDFKFLDYFSTLDQPKTAVTLESVLNETLENLPFSVSNYLYDKENYLKVLRTALCNGIDGVSVPEP